MSCGLSLDHSKSNSEFAQPIRRLVDYGSALAEPKVISQNSLQLLSSEISSIY